MKRRAQPWLGTMVEISIADPVGAVRLARAFDAAFACVAEIHRLMSFHEPASDVSRFNRAPVGATVPVDPHTCAVLRAALLLHAASDGVFNIACAPRLVAWDILPNPPGLVPDYVPGHCALTVDGAARVTKTAPSWIDVGGIAKGYAVDCAIATLAAAGIRSACVNAGGDLRVLGEDAYAVAIRNPRTLAATGPHMEIRNEALATSAHYLSSQCSDGEAPGQHVDGRDGRPLTGRFSVSVCAPACMIADALTKVVAASADSRNPLLKRFGATAFML